jgi:hypothetical protein
MEWEARVCGVRGYARFDPRSLKASEDGEGGFLPLAGVEVRRGFKPIGNPERQKTSLVAGELTGRSPFPIPVSAGMWVEV